MRRIDANRKIVARLAELVEHFPDWRFHQLLMNVGIEEPGKDKFYEESEETMDKLEASCKGDGE